MVDSDTIRGDKVFKILDQLQKDKTILNLHVLGIGYEGLTIVTGVDSNNNGDSCFLIDRPGGLSMGVFEKIEGKKAIFEFNDENRIHYKFRAIIGGLDKRDIRVEFPESIERIQRRKFFRTISPPGTKILFNADNRYEFNVLNISEGGLLINQKARFHNKSLLYVDAILESIYLVSKNDNIVTNIGIKKAEIVRINKSPETGRYNYALKILELGKNEEMDIRKFIYESQRKVLQRRSFNEV